MREQDAPPDAVALLTRAFDTLSRATGLVFVADGMTTESYDENRPVVQQDRYGNRYAPVLVDWSSRRRPTA